ncbi:hypothetical protein E4U53_000140 [Claviceps sorghi]|nr:hypothetical protein E4U53_000140 [Claviceps sorghi]
MDSRSRTTSQAFQSEDQSPSTSSITWVESSVLGITGTATWTTSEGATFSTASTLSKSSDSTTSTGISSSLPVVSGNSSSNGSNIVSSTFHANNSMTRTMTGAPEISTTGLVSSAKLSFESSQLPSTATLSSRYNYSSIYTTSSNPNRNRSRDLELKVNLDAIFFDVAASIQQYSFGLSYRAFYSLSIWDSNKYDVWYTNYCMAHRRQFTDDELLNVIVCPLANDYRRKPEDENLFFFSLGQQYVSQYSGGHISWSYTDLDTPLFDVFLPNLDFTIDWVHGPKYISYGNHNSTNPHGHFFQSAILESFQFNNIPACKLRIVVGTVICVGNGHLLDRLEYNCERAYSKRDMVEQDCRRQLSVSSVPEFVDHSSLFCDRAIHNRLNGKHNLPHSVDAIYSFINHRHQYSLELEPATTQPA